MRLKRSTPPASEPISLEEAKLHLRVDHDDEDAYIGQLIQAARERCEDVTGRALVTQTWIGALDAFPCRHGSPRRHADPHWVHAIELPMPPLVSVGSITYVDPDGQTQTLDPSAYTVDDFHAPARVVPAYGESWPSTRCQPNAVLVTFTAGAAAASVPAELKQGMLLVIGHWYANREDVITGTIATAIPDGSMKVFERFRVPYVP